MPRTAESSGRGIQGVQEHREELEDLADSDLPVSWIAETLLEATDDGQKRSNDRSSENRGR